MQRFNSELFYDSHINKIENNVNIMLFYISHVEIEENILTDVIVEFHGVKSITINDIPSDKIIQKGEYGKILNFSEKPNSANICVDWRSFSPNRNETDIYDISFDKIYYQISEKYYNID